MERRTKQKRWKRKASDFQNKVKYVTLSTKNMYLAIWAIIPSKCFVWKWIHWNQFLKSSLILELLLDRTCLLPLRINRLSAQLQLLIKQMFICKVLDLFFCPSCPSVLCWFFLVCGEPVLRALLRCFDAPGWLSEQLFVLFWVMQIHTNQRLTGAAPTSEMLWQGSLLLCLHVGRYSCDCPSQSVIRLQDLLWNHKWQVLIRLESLSVLRFGKTNLRHEWGGGGGLFPVLLFFRFHFHPLMYFWSNWSH